MLDQFPCAIASYKLLITIFTILGRSIFCVTISYCIYCGVKVTQNIGGTKKRKGAKKSKP